MSLFGQYILEREGKHIVEDENGFATYKFENGYVYVEDVYVVKNMRKLNTASKYLDKIAEEAKKKNINKMITSVSPAAKGTTASIKAIIGYKFELLSSTNDLVYFVKDI